MKWPVKKLGDICEIISGATPSTTVKEYWGDDFFWATPKDLSDLNDTEIKTTIRKISALGLKSCAATLLPINSVLFSSRAPIGLVAINAVPIATNQGFKNLVPNRNLLDTRYLYHWLTCNRKKIDAMGVGATFKEVSKAIVSKIEIPLPPLAEQQRIAALLDTADRILKQRESAIAKLDQLAQSVFVEMFGDPLANSKNFETVKVSGICKLINGRAFKPTEWKESGKPIIRIQNLNDETKPFNYTQVNYDEKYLIKNGDVLFSWSGTPGTSFGCFKWLREDGWLNQHIFKVILNEKLITADFFIMQMNLKIGELISQAHGGVGLQHVTKKMVDQLPLILPPMKLQLDFCKRVTEFEKIKHIYKNAFDSTNLLQSSLQHQSFAVN